MVIPRIIPCLLLSKGGLVKGKRYKNHRYVGDPINAIKIFNDKYVDELFILDIDASAEGRCISPEIVSSFAGECFMPLAVGGGVSRAPQAKQLIACGAEKIAINSAAFLDKDLVGNLVADLGSQSVVGIVDYKTAGIFGKKNKVHYQSGKKNADYSPVDWAKCLEDMGAGELLLSSIDREGSYSGFDLEVIKEVSKAVSIPVLAVGGGANLDDAKSAIEKGASGVCYGSSFVFYGSREAVLISYPERSSIDNLFI